MNLPLYRAKEIDSNDYIVGYIIEAEGGFWIDGEYDDGHIFHREIDTKTLSINFENMIDKNGKKIFASLSKDGVGGDIYRNGNITAIACVSHGNAISPPFYFDMSTLEVIGIHKGES